MRVHWLLPALWAFECLIGLLSVGWEWLDFAVVLLLYGPLLWATVLLHELCHCWMARRVGGTVDAILLWPLGGLSFVGRTPSTRADLKVAAAGPASHLPQVALLLGGYFLVEALASSEGEHWGQPWQPYSSILLWEACLLNVRLLCFNVLLPVYPLDGSRILVDTLFLRGQSAPQAATVVVNLALPVALLVGAMALYLIFGAQLGGLLMLFLSFWTLIQSNHVRAMLISGTLHLHPLFAGAPEFRPQGGITATVRTDAAASRPPRRPPSNSRPTHIPIVHGTPVVNMAPGEPAAGSPTLGVVVGTSVGSASALPPAAVPQAEVVRVVSGVAVDDPSMQRA